MIPMLDFIFDVENRSNLSFFILKIFNQQLNFCYEIKTCQ